MFSSRCPHSGRRSAGWVFVAFALGACVSCRASQADTESPQHVLIGAWTGRGDVYDSTGKMTAPGQELEFHFEADGSFRMGKLKVWVKGRYEFRPDGTFTLVGVKEAGPYRIIEQSKTHLVYERKLAHGAVQRTTLTRK